MPSRRRRCMALPHSTGLAHHTTMSGSSATKASRIGERSSRTKRGTRAEESQNLIWQRRAPRVALEAAVLPGRRAWAWSRNPAAHGSVTGASDPYGPSLVQLVAARLVRNDTRHRTAAFGNNHFLTGLHVCEEFAEGRLEGGNVSDDHVTTMVISSIPVKWVRGSAAPPPAGRFTELARSARA